MLFLPRVFTRAVRLVLMDSGGTVRWVERACGLSNIFRISALEYIMPAGCHEAFWGATFDIGLVMVDEFFSMFCL